MLTNKPFVYGAALSIFSLCLYLFIKGVGVFSGTFNDEPLAFYFLAKGIYCSLSLVMFREILEQLQIGVREQRLAIEQSGRPTQVPRPPGFAELPPQDA